MRIDIPEQKKLTYEMTIPIRWGDMDAMGHVNNTIYSRCGRSPTQRALSACSYVPMGHRPIVRAGRRG